eukprot:scaffold21_cov136-Skeletonema_marinoi.AAC.2
MASRPACRAGLRSGGLSRAKDACLIGCRYARDDDSMHSREYFGGAGCQLLQGSYFQKTARRTKPQVNPKRASDIQRNSVKTSFKDIIKKPAIMTKSE